MMVYLRQILPTFFLPFFVSVVVMLAGLITRRRWMIWTGLVLLWISSMPFVSGRLVRATEGWAQRIAATDAPTADAVVVLSGGRFVAPGRAAVSEWEDADRFFGGVELVQAGKSNLLIFTGGWSPSIPTAPLEGAILAKLAVALGVPPDRVLTTGPVTNTAEEARAVAALMTARRHAGRTILLVTSAFHMSRARRAFERAGFAVTPFPVDFRQADDGGFSFRDFLPNAAALGQSQMAMRELYGRLVYRLGGG